MLRIAKMVCCVLALHTLLIAALARGQDEVPPSKIDKAGVEPQPGVIDVPELAIWEAIRRGQMVQELGTVTATEQDAIADALAPPEDDSHKWYLTVVTMENCKPCEALKRDFLQSMALKAWVNVDEPAKSNMHYQVRRLEDVTQKDWLAGLKTEIDKGGLPLIVIQPPRNGEYGPNRVVVTVLHGYDGNPDKLSERMRAAITAYVREMNKRGLIKHVGENSVRDTKKSTRAATSKVTTSNRRNSRAARRRLTCRRNRQTLLRQVAR
jgi:hypothetical protein